LKFEGALSAIDDPVFQSCEAIAMLGTRTIHAKALNSLVSLNLQTFQVVQL